MFKNSPEGIEYYRLWKLRDNLDNQSDKISEEMASLMTTYWNREKPLKTN